ncbi:hypothetical protein VS868_11865 [Salinimicrobium sp. 3283s]|uniref:hypothetical protein n=1 Tax=Salinimicrobium sp. 3283s TaxID=3114359 RepID=UPI0031E547F4
MKNLLFLFLLIPAICTAQVNWFEKEAFFFASTEIDVKNAFFGGTVNDRAYDGIFNFGYRNRGFQVQASYENFKAIDFYSFELRAGHVFNHGRQWNYLLLGGLGWIQRNVEWLQKVLYPAASLSAQLEYHTGSFFFLLRWEGRLRTDLNMLKPSGFGGIGFKF